MIQKHIVRLHLNDIKQYLALIPFRLDPGLVYAYN